MARRARSPIQLLHRRRTAGDAREAARDPRTPPRAARARAAPPRRRPRPRRACARAARAPAPTAPARTPRARRRSVRSVRVIRTRPVRSASSRPASARARAGARLLVRGEARAGPDPATTAHAQRLASVTVRHIRVNRRIFSIHGQSGPRPRLVASHADARSCRAGPAGEPAGTP